LRWTRHKEKPKRKRTGQNFECHECLVSPFFQLDNDTLAHTTPALLWLFTELWSCLELEFELGMEESSRISSVDIAWSMSGNDLDVTYKALRSDVDNRCRIIDKGLRVRIQAWLAKLDEEVRKSLFKELVARVEPFQLFQQTPKQTTQL